MVRSMRNRRKIQTKNKRPTMGESSSVPPPSSKVWRPDVDTLDEGEELHFDPSAYNYLRAFSIGWPCLSFNVVPTGLRWLQTEFPHTVYGVAGTQAKEEYSNYIGIFKLSNIVGKKRKLLPASIDNNSDMDSDSSSDEEDDASDESVQPVLQLHKVAHEGGINRIRSMAERPGICATWAQKGHVEIWDFTSNLNALNESEGDFGAGGNIIQRISPISKFDGHKTEGYALDWSPCAPRLISGDCNKCIHLWEPSPEAWIVDVNPFVGHTASVEDLQWSPLEDNIFASCSVDGTIAIWDTRNGKSPALSIKAHSVDVNVISWNRLANSLIASGSDDGTVSVHDFRLLKKGVSGSVAASPTAHYNYHKKAITSIEWSPHESDTFAVTSEDNQLTIWDLALERDEEEEAEFSAKLKEQANVPENLPGQLLFVHQGQKNLKELHWHPQIPGMLISTAEDGFNVLMPANIATTLSSEDG